MQLSKRILLMWALSLIIIINLSWRDSKPIILTRAALNNNQDTIKNKIEVY